MKPRQERYWLFAGDNYYSRGGINDFKFSANDIGDCRAEFYRLYKENKAEWYQIFDTVKLKVVEQSKIQGYGNNDSAPIDEYKPTYHKDLWPNKESIISNIFNHVCNATQTNWPLLG